MKTSRSSSASYFLQVIFIRLCILTASAPWPWLRLWSRIGPCQKILLSKCGSKNSRANLRPAASNSSRSKCVNLSPSAIARRPVSLRKRDYRIGSVSGILWPDSVKRRQVTFSQGITCSDTAHFGQPLVSFVPNVSKKDKSKIPSFVKRGQPTPSSPCRSSRPHESHTRATSSM